MGPGRRAAELRVTQAGTAEIFVPYHNGTFRPYDLQWSQYLDQVTLADAGPNGSIHTLTNETVPTVVTELRDRGVGWLCKGGTGYAPSPMMVRRGTDLVIWGVVDGGNYDNIIEYGFRDDGGMTFRMGNTGFISNSYPTTAHSHIALWYVDMDLRSPNDTAYWFEHDEPFPLWSAVEARDRLSPFDFEDARQWDAAKYSALVIADGAANAYGAKISYAFTPIQDGFARQFGWKESWTQNDVYVTRARPSELGWTKVFELPDDYLLTYLDGESVNGQNLAVWIKSSSHHLPLSEDRSAADIATGGYSGITLTHWNGFKIEPTNLFDANPLGGPVQC
jgi:primary-amine oxidase